MTLPGSGRTSILFALIISVATPLYGAAGTQCVHRTVTSATQWQAPLDRVISIRAGEIELKAALDRIAAAANVRMSYSGDQLPLTKRICASYKGAIGDVLAALLNGVHVHAVVAGVDHVVLSPSKAHVAIVDSPEPVFPLEAVVVTATSEEYPPQGEGYVVSRITQLELEQQNSIAAAINANVPGVWVWQTPVAFTAQYSSRGASSFGASSPKVYIDGIEVANPLLITQLQPENIERIEVIRGPQGGALYGADAINGVTNIITRHDGVADGVPRIRLRSGLALSASEFGAGAGVSQDHNLSLQVGTPSRSAALNMAIGNVGEYMPGAFSRHLSLDGNARLIGDRTLITGTARYFLQSAGNPASLLTEPYHPEPALGMQQYTIGAKLLYRPNELVTHSFVVGVDGYGLDGVSQDSAALLSVADSVLRAAGDGALRTTLRMSSAFSIPGDEVSSALITVTADHSELRQQGELVSTGAYRIRSSLGFALQAEASLFERISVTSGLRIERDALNDVAATNTLPMLAASYVMGGRDLSVRVRSAYGKAIRWPSLPTHMPTYAQGRYPRPVLSPEEQSGLELGVDLTVNDAYGVQITRYDQTASGLLQGVVDTVTDSTIQPGQAVQRNRYALQNMGEIENHGWEIQAFAQRGALSLNAGLSFTDSRVANLADGYAGDLREGDRMLAVPARSVSVQASWSGQPWMASVSVSRAFDWINYDRVALLEEETEPTGAALRNFWRGYNGVTRLRANLMRAVGQSWTLLLSADNLLGGQVGEPDNLTVVPGRSISFGVKASF